MTILLLGDLTGRSRVALRMLTFELEKRGHEVLMLPTALISNTLNLGRAAMLDTTDYLMESLETWKSLGLSYDLVYIGYVTGLAQAEKLCRVADDARAHGVPVVVDPILGDNGRRYNSGRSEEAADWPCRRDDAQPDGSLSAGGCALRACRLAKTDGSTE